MKNKIYIAMIVALVVTTAGYNLYNTRNVTTLSNLALANVEALADNTSGENDSEKKFRYSTFPEEEYYIYVGGAYAKGKKVTCWQGSDHHICVTCQL